MTFATGALQEMPGIGSGELFGNNNVVLSATTFENGLLMGRFAKIDTGSIDNLDASATPVIAGVVLHDVPGATQQGNAVDADTTTKIEYVRSGMVVVEAVTGLSPTPFAAVFAENTAAADYGKAALAGEATNAEFIETVGTDLWLVRLV